MSRAQLLAAARTLRIATDVCRGGKRGAKDNNWLRTDIIERCYGPGLEWRFRSTAEADSACVRMAAVCRGDLGYGLSLSQYRIKQGNDALTEYKRLAALKRRRPDDEVRMLKSARDHFAAAAAELDKLEAGAA